MDRFEAAWMGGLIAALVIAALFCGWCLAYNKGRASACDDLRLRVGVDAYHVAARAEICIERPR